MEKEWFIYKGDHHTGPYDIEDVHKMFLDGNVEDSDLVWKEGLSNWVSLKILLQEHGVEVQRPKKTKFKFPTIVDTPPSTYFEDYPNLQMRNEEDIVEKDFSDIEQKDVSEVVAQESVAPPSFEKKSRGNIFNAVVAVVVLLSVLYRVLVYFNEGTSEHFEIPKLSDSDLSRLKKVVEKDYINEKPTIDLSLDKELKQIVVASNFEGEGVLQIYLKAKKGKVLGTGPSELLGEMKIKKNWGKSGDLTFIKGTRIFPGYYDVFISGHFWNDLGPMSLYLSEFPWIRNFFKPVRRIEVSHESQILFSKDGHSNFNKKLQDYNEKIAELKSYRYEGKLESYRTFKALLAQILFHFEETLGKLKRGYDIYRFENKYSKNIGPVLRNLILENRKLFMEYRDSNPNEASFYRQFFEFGKKIGEVVSNSITEIEKIKLIDQRQRKSIQKKYVNSFEGIKDELEKFSEKIKILDQMEAFGGSIFMHSY